MSKAPAHQFYPDKWLAGTGHLSAEAYRAYHRLLCHIWLHTNSQFSIKNDNDLLRIATQLDADTFNRVWPEIMGKNWSLLQRRGNYLISQGLRKEKDKQDQWSNAGKKAAAVRYGKLRSHPKRRQTAGQSQCSPSPSPSPTTVHARHSPNTCLYAKPEMPLQDPTPRECAVARSAYKIKLEGKAFQDLMLNARDGKGDAWALAVCWYAEREAKAKRVQNPGAFAASIILGDKLIADENVIDEAKTWLRKLDDETKAAERLMGQIFGDNKSEDKA